MPGKAQGGCRSVGRILTNRYARTRLHPLHNRPTVRRTAHVPGHAGFVRRGPGGARGMPGGFAGPGACRSRHARMPGPRGVPLPGRAGACRGVPRWPVSPVPLPRAGRAGPRSRGTRTDTETDLGRRIYLVRVEARR